MESKYPCLRRLKKERLKYHLTQKRLADYLGVTVQYYSQMERGINTLSFANALQLAAFFEMPTDELFESDYIESGVLMKSIAEKRKQAVNKKINPQT